MKEFEESVREIEGLTDFEMEALPEWLSERFDEMFVSRNEGPLSDQELVDRFLNDDWLDNWGAATINGQDVFIFEYYDDDMFELYEPARIAEMLFCGLVMVETSRHYRGGTIACFTEHRALIPRRKATSLELVHTN